MSIYESSITNPKKQLEFYKDLSEQLLQERNNYKELYEKEKEKNEIQGQTIKGQQHTIRLLKKHNKEQKHNYKLQYKKVKNNWNELKEWIKNKEGSIYIHKYYISDKMEDLERL